MPDTRRYRYKVFKWIACTLLSVFIVLAGIAWLLNVKSRPILTDRIKTLLYKSTDSLYTISFTKVSTNVFTGNATLQNVKIIPDTNRFKQLIALKRAPNNLYTVSLKKLVVKRFHPLTLYREKKLQLEEIIFDKPEVTMVNRQFAFNEGRAPRPIKSPYAIISKNLNEFSIKSIRFKDVSFKYINKNVPNSVPFSIDDLNITLTDLLVDSTSAEDPTRFYLLKDIVINLNNYVYRTPDKMYDIQLDKLDFRATTGKLRINSFALVPLHDEMSFGKVAGFAKERFNIKMSDIMLNGIDLPLYISKQELWAKEMAITNGFVSVFNHNGLPKKHQESKVGKFPHQLLQLLDAPILVQKIQLKDINVNYAVYNNESNQKGQISFEHTSGIIKNATNLEKIKAINPIMEVNLNTYLFGQGKLDVNFIFDLTAKDGAFSYNGVLHNFNARVLNQITKPLGLVRINRGSVDKLKFNFKANDLGAKGTVAFSYYDLSVALMKNDPEKDHLVTRGFLSFLANALIIKSENPGVDGKLVPVTVNYSRPANTSFFNMIWKSLFTGIKYSIGITEEKQNEVREHIAKFKAMRANHMHRKQKRLERRIRRERQQNEKR
ncbi:MULTISPECIES: hypothetical protein [unclassified Pedobacter]|uniref:hypothetical protein n=1 Tax=unclassified Pedobacter TaxID=2628915 RepID=UPI001D67B2CB|nr:MULTISPECIES: hypothetical protein [unclassified Pedobacter]CAH0180665.1 hypothetical protein SRABI36_01501 [Pedobacter sp. Bi36]CAH0236663.1 hypothetical protein SRABI126_02594 [Pedobacter sp. Bi126]